MKVTTASQHVANNEEFMNGEKQWLKILVAPFFKKGIQKLILHYKKCIQLNRDYIEKQFKC